MQLWVWNSSPPRKPTLESFGHHILQVYQPPFFWVYHLERIDGTTPISLGLSWPLTMPPFGRWNRHLLSPWCKDLSSSKRKFTIFVMVAATSRAPSILCQPWYPRIPVTWVINPPSHKSYSSFESHGAWWSQASPISRLISPHHNMWKGYLIFKQRLGFRHHKLPHHFLPPPKSARRLIFVQQPPAMLKVRVVR